MKKLSSLFLALLACVTFANAKIFERVQIGDLYYNLNASNQTAKVTYKSYTNHGYNEGWGITTANIPASVEYNSVTYSVTSIGSSAFRGCRGLTSVTIPNSVTSIGDGVFSYCTGLTSVTIGNSVTSIAGGAFAGCSGLTSINVASDNSNYCSVDGVLFNKDKTTLIQYPGGKQGAYTIPNSVTSIGDRAFQNCRGLTSVTIPNSVTSIGEEAFAYCTGLTSITCEAVNLPTLGYDVFDYVPKDIPLYVPAESIDLYKAADQWKEFDIKPISAIPTGINQTSQEPIANSQKLLINGQIFILRGDKTYTTDGRLVR